ncbi:MAG: UDP-3-O-(3-hydroxymyristoyl)glucosamine N-acyltransferase [bacterium]|nr:UDP-3-O-(3-hydroxymyristoyl)glucosamine N-acyltransferase [bacterium]MDT8395625.1 UDP-3-O-(3-hydroxymyristoyl)glucosamine N-acyltransferase [bacterium]
MAKITLGQLAERIGGELIGDPHLELAGVAPLHTASSDQVSFLSNPKYAASIQTTRAGAVIVSRSQEAPGLNLIRTDDPYLGFALAMESFYAQPYDAAGISPLASVHPGARIGSDPSLHPFAVVCDGARIGSRVTLMPGCYVGPGALVDDDAVLHPNVVIEKEVVVGQRVIVHAGTVIGSDGFGFASEKAGHRKIIHAGTVRVEDDVEIGAGCTIDRAVMGETVIGAGSKLDNLIQIGHNVRIGKNCILVAQVAIAGSTVLEDNVTMAGQSGAAGHLTIGEGSLVYGRAAVVKDVPAGSQVAGLIPAVDVREWRRTAAALGNIASLRKRVAALEKEVNKLQGGSREGEDS